jgi:hypothetical protein
MVLPNDNTAHIKAAAADLKTVLQLAKVPENGDREGLAKAIAPMVSQLLNSDFEKFLQLCYRLDLGEKKVREILHKCPPEEITRQMSLAIVDRQLLKVHYRKKYNSV